MRRALVVGALLALGGPAAPAEDAAGLLRIAWASQYEWRESGVANAGLDFTYTYRWDGPDDQDWGYAGQGQVVVSGNEIVRSHYPGASESERAQIASHVAWVVGRFVRRPFEEVFEDTVFTGPEPAGDDVQRIGAAPKDRPEAKRFYLLAKSRIVGLEWPAQEGEEPMRRTHVVGPLGGGYAILGEETTWRRGEEETTTSRTLTPKRGEDHPYPGVYVQRSVMETATVEVRIEFSPPEINVEHPVVGDPAARDALASAWARRYVLPRDLRLRAEFRRGVDHDLTERGWTELVKGDVQVWGLDRITVVLDERLFGDRGWTESIARRCEEHFRWVFRWMDPRPFEETFAGCGFRFLDGDEDTVAVEVIGYRPALGFLLEEGDLVGYRRNSAEPDDWWRFRLRRAGDGRRIDAITGTLDDGEDCTLRIRYTRRKGLLVPRSFEIVGGSRFGRSEGGAAGVAEYELKKIKVLE